MTANDSPTRSGDLGEPTGLPCSPVLFHGHDLPVRQGDHNVRSDTGIRALFPTLQDRPISSTGQQPGRSHNPHLLNDVLGVLEGRTRPVRTLSTGRVTPPEQASRLTSPHHVIRHQTHERLQVAFVQRSDSRLQLPDINEIHTPMVAGGNEQVNRSGTALCPRSSTPADWARMPPRVTTRGRRRATCSQDRIGRLPVAAESRALMMAPQATSTQACEGGSNDNRDERRRATPGSTHECCPR